MEELERQGERGLWEREGLWVLSGAPVPSERPGLRVSQGGQGPGAPLDPVVLQDFRERLVLRDRQGLLGRWDPVVASDLLEALVLLG